MTPTRYWITSITTDAAVALLLIAAALGSGLAGLLLMALVWIVIAGRTAVAFTGTSANGKDRPVGYLPYHALAEAALISGLWLTGHPATAAAYLVALAGFELALLRDPATNNEQEGMPA